ncbi:DoxX family protein [Haloarchaeobius sp. DFWS5]|uniref:DoxX family protein n=1 Tax=Haloarchaeobius sp. DFWS5 TaxID=3446114 RepID=UPI003EBF0BF0
MESLRNRFGVDAPSDYDVSTLLLRLGLGTIMMVHGFGKLTGMGPSGSGIDAFAGMLGSLGVPLPLVAAWVVALVEFFGGLLVLVGLFSRVAAAGIALVMIGAIVLVHLPQGFSDYEFPLLLFLVATALTRISPGKLSLEHWLATRETRETARPTT